MSFKNIVYRYKSCLLPFKSAVAAVVISVIASIAVTVVSSAGKHIITSEMDAVGMNGLAVTSYSSTGENVTDEALVDTISRFETTNNITPVLIENSTAQFSNGVKANIINWGIGKEADKVVALKITAGRMFTTGEIQSKSRVCLVDEELAVYAYNRSNLCGKKIVITTNGKTQTFTIIGTVKKGSNILNTLTGDVVPYFVYIPYTSMKDMSGKSGFDQIVFTTDDTQQTQQQIQQKLTEVNQRYERENIVLTNLAQQKNQLEKISDTAFNALFAVSCVAVIVCSMSVGSSVNTAVISRQKDIGIKISLGAGRAAITAEFVLCAMLACFTGIVIAAVIVFPLLWLLFYYTGFETEMDYTLMAASIFATIILTAVFSFMPSYNAAKMLPIKALNREQQ